MNGKQVALFATLSVLGGAASGLLITAWVARSSVTQAPVIQDRTVSAALSEPAPAPPPRVVTLTLPEVTAVSAPEQKTPAPIVSAPTPETFDPEEATQKLEAEFREDLKRHANDARDATWAPKAEQSLRQSFSSVKGSFQLGSVECKMTSCVANVTWPNREAASKEYQSLLQAHFEPNCASKILIHAGNGPDAFEEKVVLDCTNARQDG